MNHVYFLPTIILLYYTNPFHYVLHIWKKKEKTFPLPFFLCRSSFEDYVVNVLYIVF